MFSSIGGERPIPLALENFLSIQKSSLFQKRVYTTFYDTSSEKCHAGAYQAFYFFAKNIPQYIKTSPPKNLYTDENPKDTVPIKYATPADARATVAKVKRIKKPYARKIQILTVMEQRSKYGGKPEQARIAKKAKEVLKKKHGTSKISKKS